MDETLATLLHRFIDLYERDAIALDSTLRFNFIASDDEQLISDRDRLSLLEKGSEEAEREILRKTLVETSSKIQKYKSIRDDIGRPVNESINDSELEDMLKWFERFAQKLGLPPTATFEDVEVFFAASEGLTLFEYKRKTITEKLSSKKLEAEVLRFFADRIGAITDAVEKLDHTDFAERIPSGLTTLFRECHVNFMLGQFGTTVILCGVLLETSLQDLLPSNDSLKELIMEAKKNGLLKGWHRSFADKIQERRNHLVHGKQSFSSISSDWAWETMSMMRKLLADLYQGRTEGRR